MKTIIRALVYAMLITGCGSSTNGGEDLQGKNKNTCPVGNFLSDDSFNSATFGSNGSVRLNFNRCVAGGTMSNCNDGFFQMSITTAQPGLGNLPQCAQIGDYYCEYSSSGDGGYLLTCPQMPATATTNQLSSGMLFYPN